MRRAQCHCFYSSKSGHFPVRNIQGNIFSQCLSWHYNRALAIYKIFKVNYTQFSFALLAFRPEVLYSKFQAKFLYR